MSIVAVRPRAIGDRSGAIILSLDAKWIEPLKSGALRWVMRKRLPFTTTPSQVYFHAKSPASAIIGRSKVRTIEKVGLPFLLEHGQELQMNSDEIRTYVADRPTVGLMHFEPMEAAAGNVQLANIMNRLEYFPPQSFAFVSQGALPVIDEMCGF